MLKVVVNSSAIFAVGYDPRTKILEIEFKSGQLYRYKEVPRAVYDDLKKADSIGAYVNANIRDKFDFVE